MHVKCLDILINYLHNDIIFSLIDHNKRKKISEFSF